LSRFYQVWIIRLQSLCVINSVCEKLPVFRQLIAFDKQDIVDISEKMLEQAKAKKCYSRLIRAELEGYFQANKKPFDLIVSADVFTYFGDLQNLFAGIASNLKKNGRIIFTVSENNENKNDYFLHPSGRYLHHKNYVKKILKQNNLKEEFIKRERLRNEGDSQVWGYMVSAVKE